MRHPTFIQGVADTNVYRFLFPEAPWKVPEGLSRGIVLVQPLSRGVLESLQNAPTPLYFHHYRQINYFLDRQALSLALSLETKGYHAIPVPASQTLDSNDLTSHLSHRHMAFAAGLGWRGKNNLIVIPPYGSAVRLVTVLTDAPLQPGAPLDPKAIASNGCGTCHACRDACPAGAIGDSPDDFDLEACFRQVSEFRKIPRVGQRICGLCQKACAEHWSNLLLRSTQPQREERGV